MSKKHKFDLTKLVQQGYLKDGQKIVFVSDPNKLCTIAKQPNGEYKVKKKDNKIVTAHAFATECLGMEPPDHAAKWLKTEKNEILFDLWHKDDELKVA